MSTNLTLTAALAAIGLRIHLSPMAHCTFQQVLYHFGRHCTINYVDRQAMRGISQRQDTRNMISGRIDGSTEMTRDTPLWFHPDRRPKHHYPLDFALAGSRA